MFAFIGLTLYVRQISIAFVTYVGPRVESPCYMPIALRRKLRS